jgi:hypothetical protein
VEKKIKPLLAEICDIQFGRECADQKATFDKEDQLQSL